MTRYYAGIGSRQTPPAILIFMEKLAQELSRRGFVLRSGGAEGADSAFEKGASNNLKEIYLPWKGFNDNPSPLFVQSRDPELRRIAELHHPAWHLLNCGGRDLHTRNVCQILGPKADSPVEFVVCWTRLGQGRGGTGQALRIARDRGIPVYDLGAYSAEYVRRKVLQEMAA